MMAVNEDNYHLSYHENDPFPMQEVMSVDELSALVRRYSYFIGKSPVFRDFIKFKMSRLKGQKHSSKKKKLAKYGDPMKLDGFSEGQSIKDGPYIFTNTPFCIMEMY